MAWTDLKAAVAAVIKTNGNQEITGGLLQSTLNSIIDQVGANATYKGVAIPSTSPGSPDGPVFYIASTQGTYANFGGFVLDGGFAVLSNVSGSWAGTKFLKTEMDAKVDKVTDIEQVRSQATNKVPSSKLFDDEITKIINLGALYKGIAIPSTTPGVPDGLPFYLAKTKGTYSNFGGAILDGTEVKILRWSGSAWVVDTLDITTGLNVIQKTSWPLSSSAECLSQPTLNFSVMRRFLVDMYLTGQVAGKQYSATVIKRNDSGIWTFYVYEETPVSTGTPSVFRPVSIFSTTSNPENGDAITIHTLSQSGGSGIYGKVALRWSAIPNGSYSNMWASGSHMYRLDEEIFNKNKSNYIYPIDRVSENNAQIIIDINNLYGLDKINYLFANTIDYDTFTSQLSWTTQDGGRAYGDPFTGWGALFNKAGISFNCIKIPAIKRLTPVAAKKWVSIQLVVKNSASSSTILALSPKISLDPESNTVTDIIIPLMNSALTDSVTLNDASFSGSTYFIGYCFYAADGTYAFGGTVSGTQSNYAGTSYYIMNTSFTPSVPTSWSGYSGNPCIPMEHALLTGAQLVKHLKELDAIDLRLDQMQEEIDLLAPEDIDISLPDKIYATVGDRLQLFYRGMIKAPNPYIYDILVSCSKGIQYPRYFEYLPASGDVGTTTFKVEVKNKDGVVLGTKTCSLITKSVVQSPSTTKKVLCVGDSLTSAGLWCIEASRRLVGSGGTPAGLALSNIAFTGRKTGSGIGWEGTGGWTWTSYATAGRPAYKFFLSGVTTAPGIGSTYTNNGITYTVSEVNITGGTGYISATGSGAPTASGTLTKASGTGDSTLTFSSYTADSGNPFWEADTNSLDFPQYVNTYMGGACDVIYFLLTWNDQTPWRTDFAGMIATAKTLIDHIHTHYPNCKMKIMGIQVPSLKGGMGANYGATGTSYADTYGNVVTVLNMNKAYQDWCNEAAYSSFLEFVNVSAQFDSENNMPETDKAVNARSAKTEKIGTNGVHPSTEGYYQIGDVVFRNFIANFCQ